MDKKRLGYLSIALGTILIIAIFLIKYREDYYINLVIHENGGSCFLEDGTCLHEDRNLLPYMLLGILSVGFLLGGAYLSFFDKPKNDEKGAGQKEPKEPVGFIKEDFSKLSKALDHEERQLFDLLLESEGTIFQSDLVEKSGFTKVKVTRLLDKLEGKGIVERKRRGMTNVVILKH